PAEVNLRAGDIANMGFARAVRTPVALVGDVDRGGVIAQMVGPQTVIADADAALIKGFAINKFRGDPALFEDGYRLIAEKTGWRGLGVIPWFAEARKLPAEDALGLKTKTVTGGGRVKIGCLTLSRIANFDDLDPLKLEPDVDLRMIGAGEAVPGDLDLVILPGSKSTRGDLVFLKRQGWDVDLRAHVRRGGRVLGICGGYQILGRMVRDPDGVEGPAGETEGLGLLDVVTEMSRDKRLTRRVAQHAGTGIDMKGYEIHIGRTEGADCARPFARIDGRAEGARSADGRVEGTYLHGVFSSDGFRAAYLRDLGARAGICYDAQIDAVLDRLAAHLEAHMPLAGVLSLMERID
ncbi:MAG: cobyric acid synthase, partial [Pseudomonadota bacterium]